VSEDANERATAILLIAHGSREAGANQDLFDLASRLAGGGEPRVIEPAFLELAEPDLATSAARCVVRGARRVLIVPYFLSLGVHLVRDLAAAREELASRHGGVEFILGAPLGPHPLLDELVRLRIEELSALPPHRA
jgi:sirohydrochlorin ferrochelatase